MCNKKVNFLFQGIKYLRFLENCEKCKFDVSNFSSNKVVIRSNSETTIQQFSFFSLKYRNFVLSVKKITNKTTVAFFQKIIEKGHRIRSIG